jgi:hypothetical protein
VSSSFQGGGVVLQQGFNIEAEHPNPFEVAVPAAVAGTLSTRTDNDTGVLTVASGHGITTDDTVDLYDASGDLIRKDMDVTAVTGTTISIDAGSGSNLPSATTAVIVCKQTLITSLIAGDDIQFIVIGLDLPGVNQAKGRAIFEQADDTDIFEATLKGPMSWNIAGGQTNDFAGVTVAKTRVTHPQVVAGKFKIISMEDPT